MRGGEWAGRAALGNVRVATSRVGGKGPTGANGEVMHCGAEWTAGGGVPVRRVVLFQLASAVAAAPAPAGALGLWGFDGSPV